MTAIIDAAAEQNLPVVLAIGVTHEECETDDMFYTPEDMVAAALGNGMLEQPGVVQPSFYLSVQIGSKKINCKYLKDSDLVDAYNFADYETWADSDFVRQKQDEGYTAAEIKRY